MQMSQLSTSVCEERAPWDVTSSNLFNANLLWHTAPYWSAITGCFCSLFYNNPTNIQNIEPNHYSHMSLLRLRLGFDAHLDLMAQLRRRDVSNFIPTCHISAPRARTLPDIHWSIFSACRRLHVPVIRTKSLWSTKLQNHSIQRPFNAGRMSSLFHFFVFCWKHFHWYVSRLTYGDAYVTLTARTQLVILGMLFHHLYSIFLQWASILTTIITIFLFGEKNTF